MCHFVHIDLITIEAMHNNTLLSYNCEAIVQWHIVKMPL